MVAVGERVLPPSQTVLEAFPSASGTDGPLHLTLFCPPTGHNHTGVRCLLPVRWEHQTLVQ